MNTQMTSGSGTPIRGEELIHGPTSSIEHFLFIISFPESDNLKHLPCRKDGGRENIELLLSQRYGLDVNLTDREKRIPVRLVSDLANWLSRLLNDPVIGLNWMARGNDRIIIKEWLSIKHVATNAMECFEFIMRYHRLYSELFDFDHDIRDSEWTLRFIDNDPEYTSHHLIDIYILITIKIFKDDFNSLPKRVELSHDCPKGMEPKYEKYYGCEVIFNSDNHKIVYHSSEAIKQVRPKNQLCQLEMTDNKLGKYLADNPSQFSRHDSFAQQTEFWIERLLMRGEPTCEQVAKHMAVSVRTMQRRLKAENVSFLNILDDCRKDLCEKYLRDPSLKVTDIAWLLGYVDASQFYRAFQRWMGMPMIEYRRKLDDAKTKASTG